MNTCAHLTHASHGAHALDPLTVVLVLLLAGVGYAVSLYVWPLRPCPRCKGERVNRGSTGRRFGLCKRCAGTGRTRRLGATAVHRFYWSVVGERLRTRRHDRTASAQRRAQQPDPKENP